MDINELLAIGAKLFKGQVGQAGKNLDLGNVVSALSGLLSDGKGGINLGSIVSKLNAGGLATLAASWLGNGANDAISTDQITNIFNKRDLSGFATKLGLDQQTAVKGLTAALPEMMDKSSRDGNILDSIGGISGALGGLKNLFD